MLVYRTSALINASPENVWRVLSDVMNWPAWTPTITEVTALGARELRVGSRFKVLQPKLRPATWTVTSAVANSGFVWESSGPGIKTIAEHVLEPAANDQTRVNLSFAFQGLLGAVVGRLSKSLVESYLSTEANSLRKQVEEMRSQEASTSDC